MVAFGVLELGIGKGEAGDCYYLIEELCDFKNTYNNMHTKHGITLGCSLCVSARVLSANHDCPMFRLHLGWSLLTTCTATVWVWHLPVFSG